MYEYMGSGSGGIQLKTCPLHVPILHLLVTVDSTVELMIMQSLFHAFAPSTEENILKCKY